MIYVFTEKSNKLLRKKNGVLLSALFAVYVKDVDYKKTSKIKKQECLDFAAK